MKGNGPGIGEGGIIAANIQHQKRNRPGKGGKTEANGHARPKERGIEKSGEIAANNAKRNGSGIHIRDFKIGHYQGG